MNKPRNLLLAVYVAACGAAFQSNAGDKDPESIASGKVDFATLDRNADDRLTSVEASVIRDLDAAFARLDADGNQRLSRDEYSRWHRARKPAKAEPADPATRPSGSAGAQHMPTE